jgi:hypothetical protein
MEEFMKTLALLFSTALCFTALPAAAGAPGQLITLAQADVRVGPGGVTIGRERDHDRDRLRVDEGRGHGRDCKTVTVEENGRSRTTRECD